MQPNRLDKYNVLYDLEAATSAISAFNHLVTAAIEQGDDFSYVSGGVHHLLEAQIEKISAANAAIREEYRRIDKETAETSERTPKRMRDDFIAERVKEGVDAGEIAQALNLKKETVERVIGQLLGQQASSIQDSLRAGNE